MAMRLRSKIILSFAMLAAMLLAGYGYLRHSRLYPKTDDAYIQAYVVNMGPRVSGYVDHTYVENNQSVTKGQLLFSLDPAVYQASLDKAQATLQQTIQTVSAQEKQVQFAKANLDEREAELINAEKNYHRINILVKKGTVSKAQGDETTSRLHVARAARQAANSRLAEIIQKLGKLHDANAQIQAAKAAVDQALLDLQYTRIYAPSDGKIANYSLRVGDELTADQSYFALVETQYWWAEANFKETDLTRIHPGQPAEVRVDMYPDQVIKGEVVSISPGSGTSFSLLPPENATGNWVKVTQRFPVRVHLLDSNPRYPLRLGASCTVTVDTTSASS